MFVLPFECVRGVEEDIRGEGGLVRTCLIECMPETSASPSCGLCNAGSDCDAAALFAVDTDDDEEDGNELRKEANRSEMDCRCSWPATSDILNKARLLPDLFQIAGDCELPAPS